MDYLDILEYLNEMDQNEEVVQVRRRVHNPIYTARRQIWNLMDDAAFKYSSGLTKTDFEFLCQLVSHKLAPTTRKGAPVELRLKVLTALNILRGDLFQLKSAEISGVSKRMAHDCLHDFCDALVDHKETYIRMPTLQECAQTSNQMWDRFGLKGCALGIDGVLMLLHDKPRFKTPPEEYQAQGQAYWNYKGSYGFNAMIVADGM